LAIGKKQLAIGKKQLAIGKGQLAIGKMKLAISKKQLAISKKQLAIIILYFKLSVSDGTSPDFPPYDSASGLVLPNC